MQVGFTNNGGKDEWWKVEDLHGISNIESSDD